VLAAVEAICGPVSLLAYSSSGATPENRKWRVLIPVMGVLTGAEYELAQTALFDLLHANGIHPDGALARCGQPIYLPNVPLDKRNPDLSPIFYVMRVIRAKTLRLDDSPIRQEIDRRLEQYRLAAEQAQIASRERERQRAERRQKFPDQVSPVDAFNADHDIGDLLLRYQYERQGASKHYRSRYQTSPSYATQDFGDHWVSLSGSDAAAGVGKPKSLGENAYCWGDAFDLFCHYEHDGDFDKAVRAYGLEISPAKAEIELPENGLDDFDYMEPQSAQEAPASAESDDIDLGSFDTPDAPEAAPDWPTVYDMFDGASIEPRRWIYGHHYLRSFVSVLASAGGIGKTSLQIVEALAIVTGRPLLGEEVKERTNVWIVNLEDPLEEIQRRVIAAMQHYKITPEEVRGRLFVNAGRDFSLKFGIQTREGVLPNTKLVEYLCKQIPQKKIGCVFIDPFVGAHSINENDNMAVNAIVAEIRRVADETKSAIGLVHHIRKGNGEDASIDSVRGAGSLIGAARAARVVNRMSADDAAKLGIDETEARSIFRVDDGKANLAPPASAALYRKMEGVKIDNGEWIGVCVPYTLPDAFDGISGKDAKAAQRIVADAHTGGEPLRESQQSPKWVGIPIADMLGIDITEKRGKAKVASIVKTWIKTNVLAVERITDPRQAREVAVVVVGEWISHDEV
jgi:hypothetical protein